MSLPPPVGLAHGILPPPPQPDHVQQSVAWGLHYGTGDLCAYEPIPHPQDTNGRQP